MNYLDGPTGVASLKKYPTLHTTDLKIEDAEGVVICTLVMMLGLQRRWIHDRNKSV